MTIDWNGLTMADAFTSAALQNADTEKKLGQAQQQNAQNSQDIYALNLALRERNEKIERMEAYIAQMEGELRHHKARDMAFLAEVRALLSEIKKCPSEHHRLHIEDESGRAPLDDIFTDAYNDAWKKLG